MKDQNINRAELSYEGEDLYKMVLESSRDVLYCADIQTLQFTYITPSVLALTGFTAQAIKAGGLRGFSEIIHPEDRSAHWSHFKALIAQGPKADQMSHVEYRIKRKDGLVHWYSDYHTLFFGSGGAILVGNVRDITESKQTMEELQRHRLHLEEQVAERTCRLQQSNQNLQEEMQQRRQVEEEIRRSEQRYHSLFDNMPLGLFRATSEGRIVDVNPALAAMLDFPDKDTLLRQRAEEAFVNSSEWDDCKNILSARRTIKGRETRLHRFQGEAIWVRMNVRAVWDEGEQVWYYEGSLEDITERKEMEALLEEEHRLLRTIIDAIPDHIYVKDLQSRYLVCNKYIAEHVAVCAPEEMIGKSDFDYMRAELAEQYYAEEQQLFGSGEAIINKEEVGRDRDGRDMWVLSSKVPLRNRQGEIVGLVGIGRDITERKKFDLALRESEERFRFLSESAFEGVVVHCAGRIIHANTAYYQMLGYTPGELEGVNAVDQTIVPEDAQQVWLRIQAGDEGPYEVQARRKDGTGFPVEIHVRRMCYQGQEVRIAALRDITWRKQAEAELDQYRQRILQVEQIAQLSMLSATMAHELNQPLSVIRLLLQDCLMEIRDNPSPRHIREHLDDCLEEIAAAAEITHRYKKLTRIPERGKIKNISLGRVAQRVFAVLGASAAQARVSMDTEELEALPEMEGKRGDLEQIFFILVQNAIQAADRKKQRKLCVKGRCDDSHIFLTFSDDCGGIRPDHLPRIFEPFFTTKPPEDGTGLGLCIVNQILNGYGGKITVESRWGEGTTFTVMLPRQLP